MNGAETRSRRGQAGRAAAMNSAEQTVTWLITLGVLESPKKTISDPEGFLQASLKDGVVLCRLLERLLPGTIEKVSDPPPRPGPRTHPRRTGPGRREARAAGGPARTEAARPPRPPPRPGVRRDARARGRRRPHLVAARARGGAHALPLCAGPGARGARGRRGGAGGGIPPGLGAPLCAGPAGSGGRVRGERPEEAGVAGAPPAGGGAAPGDLSRNRAAAPAGVLPGFV